MIKSFIEKILSVILMPINYLVYVVFGVGNKGEGKARPKPFVKDDFAFTSFAGSEDKGFEFEEVPFKAASTTEGFSLNRVFSDEPHHFISPLQKRAVIKLFEQIGATYVPRRLENMLKQRDAFTAVSEFLRFFKLNYSEILNNSESQEKFVNILALLIEADQICLECKLSDVPIYKAIMRGGETLAESIIKKLHDVRRVYNSIKDIDVIFPAYREQYIDPVSEKLRDWEKIESDKIQEMHDDWVTWHKLQDFYDELSGLCEEAISFISVRVKPDEDIYETISVIALEFEKLLEKITSGKTNPTDGVEALDNIYADLIELKNIVEERSAGPSGAESEPEEDEYAGMSELDRKIQRCAETMGLKGIGLLTQEILKKTFRKLSMKLHPDRNLGDESAHEKFVKMKQAYHELCDILERGVVAYA